MRLRHGSLVGVPHVARTSGAAFRFVLERLSNTLARVRRVWERQRGSCAVDRLSVGEFSTAVTSM